MEGSENSKVENSIEEKINDGLEKVQVEEIDFVDAIELPPESLTKHDEPVAVEVTQAEEKNIVEKSGSSEVTVEEKKVENFSVVSEPEVPAKELVSSEYDQKQDDSYASVDVASTVASETETKTLEEAALPISDTNVVESSGASDSISKENVVESSEPIAVPPGDAPGGGDHDLSENPSSTENQPAAVLTPHTRTWMNCCGLFDALRLSNQ